jgi:hypothetical protein
MREKWKKKRSRRLRRKRRKMRARSSTCYIRPAFVTMLMTEFSRVKRRSGHDAVEEARGTRQAMTDQAQLPVLSVLLVTFYMRRFTRHNQCVHLAASIPPARPCGVVESVSLQQTRTRFLIVPAHDSKCNLLYVRIELVFAQSVSLTLREQPCDALPYSARKG